MDNVLDHSYRQRGIIAITIMIFMAAVIIVVGVGLAIMNLDYSLSGTSDLLGQNLGTAVDGCLDSALAELRNNNSATTINVNSIGTNVNCVATIRSNGNYRYVTARATSSNPFLNSVSVASSTVNVATNPYTVVQRVAGLDPRSNTLSLISNVNVGSSSGLYATVAVNGDYAYVSYRDGGSGNKLSISRIDLKTFTVGTTLQNVSTYAATYMDSLVSNGYLYVAYHNYTGVNGTDGKVGIAKVDLSNFSSGGVTLLDNLSRACPTAGCVTFPLTIANENNYIYVAYRHPTVGGIYLKSIDASVFASTTAAVSTLKVTTGYGVQPDMVVYNGYAYLLTLDSSFSAPLLFKINLSTNAIDSKVNIDPLQSATYYGLAIVDNFAYAIWDDASTSRNITIGKFDIDTLKSVATTTTSYSGSYVSVDTANGYLYISSNKMPGNTDVNMYKVSVTNPLRITQLANFTTGDLYERPQVVAPGGQYIYDAFYDRGASRARLYKIKID